MDPAIMEKITKQEEVEEFAMGQFEGIPLLQTTCDSWDTIRHFQARQDDILVATYPKSGTTWMQEIVDLIMLEGDVKKSMRAPCFIKVPFIEQMSPRSMKSGVERADEMTSQRIIKTHLPIQLVPNSFWEKNCKVVYVARNAKDCMVSYFHFQQINKILPNPGSWDEYFSTFVKGKVPWGSWFDHVINWWKAKDQHQILFVFYEDMIVDPKREIRKVMKFMGKDHSEEVLEKIYQHTSFQAMKENPMTNYSVLPKALFDQSITPFMRKVPWGSWFDHVINWWKAKDQHQILFVFYEDMIVDPKREIRKVMKFMGKDHSEEVLEKIYQHTSFQAMKENPMTNYSVLPKALLDQSITPFMRKGTVGDWKNHFTVAQNIVFDEEYNKKMEGSGLNFKTEL